MAGANWYTRIPECWSLIQPVTFADSMFNVIYVPPKLIVEWIMYWQKGNMSISMHYDNKVTIWVTANSKEDKEGIYSFVHSLNNVYWEKVWRIQHC